MNEILKVKHRTPYHRADADVTDHAQIIIDPVHWRIHNGMYFVFSQVFLTVGNNANVDILIKVGSKGLHATFSGGLEDTVTERLYENPTISSDSTGDLNGTPISIINKNRFSGNGASPTVFHTPTIDQESNGDPIGATELFHSILRPEISARALVVDPVSYEEWILNINTNYLIRLTNTAGVAKNVAFKGGFYELT